MSATTESIKMYTVHSTRVKAAGWYWDETTKQGVAVLEFKQGIKYMYFPVPNDTFSKMFEADSKGKWIEQNLIKNPDVKFQKFGQPKML